MASQTYEEETQAPGREVLSVMARLAATVPLSSASTPHTPFLLPSQSFLS